jgi:hypothetical protein
MIVAFMSNVLSVVSSEDLFEKPFQQNALNAVLDASIVQLKTLAEHKAIRPG